MKRHTSSLSALLVALLVVGLTGCAGDPNIEGARLDLRNRDFDRAMQNVQTALERDPNNVEAYMLKGQIHQEMARQATTTDAYIEHVQQLVEAYERVEELAPARASEVQERRSFAYFSAYERGAGAFGEGETNPERFEDAYHYFRATAIVAPDSVTPHINQAYALLNAGRQQDAIEPFERAIETGAAEEDVFAFLAELYQMAGREQDAVSLLERGQQQFPGSSDLQAQLLNAYIRADMIDRAREVYGQAVANEPENHIYRYNYGSLLLQAGQYEEAVEQLRAATRIDGDYGHAWFNLGVAFINQAAEITEQMGAADDRLREQRAQLSAADRQAREQEIDRMDQQRRALFAEAITPLERAKTIAEREGEDTEVICQALFQAYMQTRQQEKAQAIAQCAGYADLN
jgi:tetratricopeptide (TPR) repeat protein